MIWLFKQGTGWANQQITTAEIRIKKIRMETAISKALRSWFPLRLRATSKRFRPMLRSRSKWTKASPGRRAVSRAFSSIKRLTLKNQVLSWPRAASLRKRWLKSKRTLTHRRCFRLKLKLTSWGETTFSEEWTLTNSISSTTKHITSSWGRSS